jgi:hypothetical protein
MGIVYCARDTRLGRDVGSRSAKEAVLCMGYPATGRDERRRNRGEGHRRKR